MRIAVYIVRDIPQVSVQVRRISWDVMGYRGKSGGYAAVRRRWDAVVSWWDAVGCTGNNLSKFLLRSVCFRLAEENRRDETLRS